MRMDWNDDWENELGREIRRHYQRTFDRLSRTHKGRPKDEIRQALVNALGIEGEPDEDLEEYVEVIHEGGTVNVQVELT